MIRPRYLRIAKRLTVSQLQRMSAEGLDLSEQDFFHLDIGRRGDHLFLGFYSRAGLDLVMKKYGVYRLLARKGFHHPVLKVDTGDPYRHRLTIYNDEQKPASLVADLVVKKTMLKLDVPFDHPQRGNVVEALEIDWLGLQNPRQKFHPKRPRLPGQTHPGLGIAGVVLDLLLIACWRLKLTGLVNVPAYLHAALLYARVFHYIHPEAEGQLIALKRDLKAFSLQKASWAVEWNCVYERKSKRPLVWQRRPQFVSLSEEIRSLFRTEAYRTAVAEAAASLQFAIDHEAFDRKTAKAGIQLY